MIKWIKIEDRKPTACFPVLCTFKINDMDVLQLGIVGERNSVAIGTFENGKWHIFTINPNFRNYTPTHWAEINYPEDKIQSLAPNPVPPALKDLHDKHENSIQQTFGKHQVEGTQAPPPDDATLSLKELPPALADQVIKHYGRVLLGEQSPQPPVKPIEKLDPETYYMAAKELALKINEIIDRINEMGK